MKCAVVWIVLLGASDVWADTAPSHSAEEDADFIHAPLKAMQKLGLKSGGNKGGLSLFATALRKGQTVALLSRTANMLNKKKLNLGQIVSVLEKDLAKQEVHLRAEEAAQDRLHKKLGTML